MQKFKSEEIFAVAAPPLRFGRRVIDELGHDALALGIKRAALFIDKNLQADHLVKNAIAAISEAGIGFEIYSESKVEPTDISFKNAADFAINGKFDGFISIGGGSVMDTAKAANLYSTYPADFLTYVAKPYGEAKAPPAPLKPHIACPTTCGTGSECTGIAVFDFVGQNAKTVITHSYLRPNLALVDPRFAYSLPQGVVASTGFDVLTHAIESYTARPFTQKPKAEKPALRPMSQGANPWSDIGSLEAIKIGGKYLEAAVKGDEFAREQLMLAATLAGVAFGNAGVHLPHALSYAIAGLKHDFIASGYEKANPMIPHGVSVVITAPAVFAHTYKYMPERHDNAASVLGAHSGQSLAQRLLDMMKNTGLPNGLGAMGFNDSDLPGMSEIAFAQKRLIDNAPVALNAEDIENIFKASMQYW